MTADKIAAMIASETRVVCDVDAGPIGLVVYAATPAEVARATRWVAAFLARVGIASATESPVAEPDEPEETRWVAAVAFDWNDVPRSVSASDAKAVA